MKKIKKYFLKKKYKLKKAYKKRKKETSVFDAEHPSKGTKMQINFHFLEGTEFWKEHLKILIDPALVGVVQWTECRPAN